MLGVPEGLDEVYNMLIDRGDHKTQNDSFSCVEKFIDMTCLKRKGIQIFLSSMILKKFHPLNVARFLITLIRMQSRGKNQNRRRMFTV